MKNYAKIFDNRCVKVIVADKEYFNTYVDDSPGFWIETSEELTFHTASVGYLYNSEDNAFYEPRPGRNGVLFNSWNLDENYNWQPPIDYPENLDLKWNEENQSWEEVTNGD